jgi:L-seryl-tRNA(Ser) seleniumtransferase
MNDRLRSIPQVEQLLQEKEIFDFRARLGHPILVKIIRSSVEEYRSRLLEGEDLDGDHLRKMILDGCRLKQRERLQRVINGTGVLIHTNLGRSPLPEELLQDLARLGSGYCNLEYYIPEGQRGKRGGFAEELISLLTGAEDALIVNNNASSVFLILNHFAREKPVLVSRGELIQIGGGFRIPDIMDRSGARMVEVGTTNITTLGDYRNSLDDETAMIFSAHRSNFLQQGFTSQPTLKELASLKDENRLLVRDMGSGNIIEDPNLPGEEPTVTRELRDGADLVCFSGDKLLGGCQAGIIAGKGELIRQLRSNPLMRMIRVDRVTYYILQQVLLHYANGEEERLPVRNMIGQGTVMARKRVDRLLRSLKGIPGLERVPSVATIGGGALPGSEVESTALGIYSPQTSADRLYRLFLDARVPVVGRVENNTFTLDGMTLLDRDIPDLKEIIPRIVS